MAGKKHRRLKRFRNGIIFAAARALLAVGPFIPTSIGHALGGIFGLAAHSLAARERKKTLRNLRLALGAELPDRGLRKIARGMFVHFGRVAFEVLRLPRLTRKLVGKSISFEGLEHVRGALETGAGVVVATGHIGNWELLGAAAAGLGFPVNTIARRIYDSKLNDLVVALRARCGVRSILRDSPGAAKEILRSLRRGEMLALLIDQDIDVEGAFVGFFGRPAYTPTGAAALALRTGACLLAAYCHRLGPGRHRVTVKPVEVSPSGDLERDIIEATARATAILEDAVRSKPEQWCWNHDRWRRSPEVGKK